MSFRRRIILLSAGAVAASIVIASVVVYLVTRNELRGQIDASLRQKLVPGPQSVELTRHVSVAELRSLQKEGKLPKLPARAIAGGEASGDSGTAGAKTGFALPVPLSESVGQVARAVHVSPQALTKAATQVYEQRLLTRHSTANGPGFFAASSPGGAQLQLIVPAEKGGGPTGFAQLLRPNGQLIRSSGPAARSQQASTRRSSATQP